jgi:hypothetical protein
MKRVLVASVAPMLLLAQFSDGFARGRFRSIRWELDRLSNIDS